MKELINELAGKIIFFDFDGVLAPYQSTENVVHVETEDYIKKHIGNNYAEVFKYAPASKFMRDLVSRLSSDNIYVLTQCATSFEYKNKIDYINANYPNIKTENIHFVAESAFKANVIDELYNSMYIGRYKKADIVMVEDTVSVIIPIENKGYKCYHISSFLV